MAAKRRTRGLGAIAAVPSSPSDSESVRIRPIANGYIIAREGVRRGKYFTHEEFSPTKPVITAGAPAKSVPKAAPRKSTPRGHIRPGSL